MKRSKIFLAVSSACLAIVGIAATKAHRVNHYTAFYQTNGAGSTVCNLVTAVTPCSNTGVDACSVQFTYKSAGGIYRQTTATIFTQNRPCVQSIKTVL